MDEHDLADDPIAQLQVWLGEARESVSQPEAMTLATADPSGRPSARVVLLRGIDDRGLAFFTNRASRKADELRQNPRAASCAALVGARASSASRGLSRRGRPRRSRPPIGARGRVRARLRAGRPLSQNRSTDDPTSTFASPLPNPDLPEARFRCRRSGAAIASSPRPSSSGHTAMIGFTTACATHARARTRAGYANGSHPDAVSAAARPPSGRRRSRLSAIADQWRGSGGTGRFPRLADSDLAL